MRSKASILIGAALLVVLGLALSASPASAESTHKLLESWPTGLTQPEVGGLDGQGNVYVYDATTNTVNKFDDKGNPVNFSLLGTNVIDGKGGFNCPAVPTDCDRVPDGELKGSNGFNQGDGEMAVDVRTSGPMAGYIYVVNASTEPQPGRTEVFAPTGKYLGQLNRDITFPSNCVENCLMNNVEVDSLGGVYQSYCCGAQIDKWLPKTADPKDMTFAGQLRAGGLGGWTYGAGGQPYSYGLAGFFEGWKKYDNNSFLEPRGVSPELEMPFGDGGVYPDNSEFPYTSMDVDPYTQDVYLHGAWTENGILEQWDKDDNKIGPTFGKPGAGEVTSVGFHADGRLFMRGSANGGTAVAVFSDDIPIPDISYGPAGIDHEAFTANGTVSLDGGPAVESCIVEYGTGLDAYGNPTYGSSVPCEPATPYAGETAVSAEITGLNTETTYQYRIVAKNENGTSPGANRVARPAAVLDLSADPATDVDRTTATINGSFEADELATTYFFEYGIDTEYDSSTPKQSLPAGTKDVDVSAPLEKLQPGRVYHYRVVAQNSLGTSRSADMTFRAASSPAISGVRATDLTTTGAVLNARVDPGGYATTYQFEYGTTPAYGSSSPATPASAGSGTGPVAVSTQLSGLEPGVVYHFRIVAENEWGTSTSDNTTFNFAPPQCPNEHVRQQTGANNLPDCRAYELVSPPSAGAVQLFPSSVTTEMGEGYGLADDPAYSVTPQNTGLASGPSRFSFFGGLGSITGFDAPNALIDMYVSTRTATGWVTSFPGRTGSEVVIQARPQCSSSMDRCIQRDGPDLLGSGEQAPLNAPYLYNVDGTFEGRWPTNLGAIPNGEFFFGEGKASGDFTNFVFSSRERAYAPGGAIKAPGSIYDNDIVKRTVRIASKLPDGTDIPSDGGGSEDFLTIPNVSEDGSHILMASKADDGPRNLYMRVDGLASYAVSRDTGATYIGMTTDGTKVIFASGHRLTPDDTDESTDIYEWNEAGGADELTLLSKSSVAGNSDECNASYTSQCNAEPLAPERGRTQFGEPGPDDYIGDGNGGVYFFSPEQLDPDNPGIANQRNLYVSRGHQLKYVATLDPGTTVNRMQISPDADRAALITAAQLTGFDNEGVRQMYTYNADTGVVQCASCNPSGAAPTADVLGSGGGPFMADDGRAFFTSPDALVPEDSNGLRDVYEFVDGRPQLITTGTTDKDLYAGGEFFPKQFTGLEAVSADGVDVYFSTFATLVPEDINGEYVKFYVARTGGGFPIDPGLQPCTAADECAGEPSRKAAEPLVSTGTQLDRGQVPNPPKSAKKKKSKKKKGAKKKAAKKKRTAKKNARSGR